MIKNLTPHDVLKFVNAGIALHDVPMSLSTDPYSAEVYFAAGFCDLKMAEGAEILDALAARDQKLIRHLARQTMEGGLNGAIMALNSGIQIILEEGGDTRRLVSSDFQEVAQVSGTGYNAPVIIQLSNGFKVSGETLLAHAEVDGEQRYLIKQRTPVEMICCAIALIKERRW